MKPAGYQELKHIPGGEGAWPIIGNFIEFTTNTLPYLQAEQQKNGDVFKGSNPLGYSVIVTKPEANKILLVDQAKSTSNQLAWELALGELFPNGLMLMDGDKHKTHRSIILEAFKPKPMQGYLDELPAVFESEFEKLDGRSDFDALPFFKRLTLKIAAKIFFGFDLKGDINQIDKAITAIVEASTALPLKLPFTRYQKGINGRAFLVDYFKQVLPERRSRPGTDLFSRLCEATNESGERLSDQEIIDHLIFVLMAAHDTTAITLTWMSYFMAKYPEWQVKMRREAAELNTGQPLKLSDLRALESASLVLKETLRIHPPLILIPRFLTEELELEGQRLPAGTVVNTVLQMTHQDERVWTHPELFDPERFNAERKEHNRCPFAYMPFGAGNHHCIGFQFAEMSAKLGISMLLDRFELSLFAGYESDSRAVPFKQPKDKMPLRLNRHS